MAGIDVDRQASGGVRGCVSDGNVARFSFPTGLRSGVMPPDKFSTKILGAS